MMLRSWQHTINQDECLLIILKVQGGQEGVYKKLGQKLKTLTTNPKYVTGRHFQEKLSPCFGLAKCNRNPLAISVFKPE